MPLSNPFASQDEEVSAEKAPKKKTPKQEEEIQIEDIPF
jgi:hypothetical protein